MNVQINKCFNKQCICELLSWVQAELGSGIRNSGVLSYSSLVPIKSSSFQRGPGRIFGNYLKDLSPDCASRRGLRCKGAAEQSSDRRQPISGYSHSSSTPGSFQGILGRSRGRDVGTPSPATAALPPSPSRCPFLWDSPVELKNPLGIPAASAVPAELCVPPLPKGGKIPKSRRPLEQP